MAKNIYYLVPDNPHPSWGVAILYKHVELLRSFGYQSYILHSVKGFKIKWLSHSAPVVYLSKIPLSKLSQEDIIVVPEVSVAIDGLKNCKAKKILFIQAMGYTFNNLPKNETHKSLGFSMVFIIMPHMINIVEKFINLPYTLIPPFIEERFFETTNIKRSRKILISPKFKIIDYDIVIRLLNDMLSKHNLKKGVFSRSNKWELVQMTGLKHADIRKLMYSSEIFISLNTFEALNTSVVEAMAAGNFIFTYEGFGPKDYLRNNINAFVFPNNQPYELLLALEAFILDFDNNCQHFVAMRNEAQNTAKQYSLSKTQEALYSYFSTQI